jgi:hypothetical protein
MSFDPGGMAMTRVTLVGTEDGQAALVLNEDDPDLLSAGLYAYKDGTVGLEVRAKDDQERLTAGVDGEDRAKILMRDKDDKIIWKAPGE